MDEALKFQLNTLELSEVIETDKEINRGAYGRVIKVYVHGTLCAAKIIHPVLLDRVSAQEAETTKRSFCKECVKASRIRHPNVVQMLGIYYPTRPEAKLPWLVMEMMETNLKDFLEKHDREKVPLCFKLSILVDVAQGLEFLHGQDIAHRDLSSNNVLLTKNLVAKIADLGVAKLIPADRMRKHSQVPGTPDFMPPEALSSKPYYDKSIDVFSLACVTLHVMSHQWPQPKEKGTTTALTEINRRDKYIAFCTRPALKYLVELCLHNNPEERPKISVVCVEFKKLKVTIVKEKQVPFTTDNKFELFDVSQQMHIQNQQLSADNDRLTKEMMLLIQGKDQEIQERDKQIWEKVQELEVKDKQLQEKHQSIKERDKQLQEEIQKRNKQIWEKDQELQVKGIQLQEKDQKIQEKDKELREKDQNIKERDIQIIQLQEKHPEMQERFKELQEKYLELKERLEQLTEKYLGRDKQLQKQYDQQMEKLIQENQELKKLQMVNKGPTSHNEDNKMVNPCALPASNINPSSHDMPTHNNMVHHKHTWHPQPNSVPHSARNLTKMHASVTEKPTCVVQPCDYEHIENSDEFGLIALHTNPLSHSDDDQMICDNASERRSLEQPMAGYPPVVSTINNAVIGDDDLSQLGEALDKEIEDQLSSIEKEKKSHNQVEEKGQEEVALEGEPQEGAPKESVKVKDKEPDKVPVDSKILRTHLGSAEKKDTSSKDEKKSSNDDNKPAWKIIAQHRRKCRLLEEEKEKDKKLQGASSTTKKNVQDNIPKWKCQLIEKLRQKQTSTPTKDKEFNLPSSSSKTDKQLSTDKPDYRSLLTPSRTQTTPSPSLTRKNISTVNTVVPEFMKDLNQSKARALIIMLSSKSN